MENPKIILSIIVPIYNVAQYLCKCVDSLLAQDIPSDGYEIILVDDGSTDGSGELCDKIAQANDGMSRADALNEPLALNDGKSLIRVIHQKNGGLSAARNSGIAVAQGKYVMFVDSDDFIETNVIGTLIAKIEREQLDVLRFDYQNVRLNSAGQYEVFQPYKFPHPVDKRTDVVSGERYMDERMGYACYACQFVINRELTGTFTPGIHFEDVDWFPRMMLAAKRVNSTSQLVYNYFWREGSITQVKGNKEKVRKNIEDFLYVIEKYNSYLAQYPNCKWLKNMQSNMASGVLTTIAREFNDEREEYIKRLNEMNVFPLSIADQGKTYARRAKLLNLIGPKLYCMLMRLKNK